MSTNIPWGSEDIDEVLLEANPDYSMTWSDFERQNEMLRKSMPVAGRGHSIQKFENMAKVKLAANIARMKDDIPLGHLATTREILESSSAEQEICATLRTMGINSQDVPLSSATTRKNPEINEKLIMEGNFPVILDDDFFAPKKTENFSDVSDDDDENLPLHERFQTIFNKQNVEQKVEKVEKIKRDRKAKPKIVKEDAQQTKSKKKTKWRKLEESISLNDSNKTIDRYYKPASIGVDTADPELAILTPRDFYALKAKTAKFSSQT